MTKWMYLAATWYPNEHAIGGYDWDELDLMGQSLTGGLDQLGSEGWEMCASHVSPGPKPSFHFIFKMPAD